MFPGEEDQEQLIDNVLVRNIEIMLERRPVDVSVDLIQIISISIRLQRRENEHSAPRILFHALKLFVRLESPSGP
jgi:hypothetical protein